MDDSPGWHAAPDDDAAASVPPVGAVVGSKYRIERVIGSGGMAVVVAARHLHLQSMVAIKFPRPDAIRTRDGRSRFLREAQAAFRIRSAHVVRIIDIATLDTGAPYVVLEYLEGRDLSRVVEKRKALPPDDAVDYVLQACDAVAEAHSLGIIHRDLKPANLFLTQGADGRPLIKVLDFGIAKAPGYAEGEASAGITDGQGMLGSPAYASPEQLRNARDVDQRTDIWSLGVILYELLSGKPPFGKGDVVEVVARILSEDPAPVSESTRSISPGLDAVVARCLEKPPNRRYPTIAALARALRPFARSSSAALLERIERVGGADDWPTTEFARGTPTGSKRGAPVAARREREPTIAETRPDPPLSVPSRLARMQPLLRWLMLGVAGLATVAALTVMVARSGRGRQPAETTDPRSAARTDAGGKGRAPGHGAESLVVLQSRDVTSLDPVNAIDVESINALTQTHEALVSLDPVTGAINAELATSWRRSGDSYVFDLRPGVRFSDRSALTSKAVADSLNRSRTSGYGKATLWDVRDVAAIDERRVAVRTTGTSGSLLARLAMPTSFISLPRSPYPTGTGPFMVKTWTRQSGSVVLQANDSYWGGAPKVSTLVFKAVHDGDARASMLLQGDAAIALGLARPRALELRQSPQVHVYGGASPATLYLVFNTSRPYLRDPRVRRALAWAIDSQSLVEQLPRSVTRASGSFQPGLGGVRIDEVLPQFSPQRARAVLAPLGFNRTLRLYVSSEERAWLPEPRTVARILVAGLKAAGVNVEPVFVPYDEYRRACNAGEHDLALDGWIPDYPDPENVYFLLSKQGSESQLNFAHFSDPEFESLLARVRDETRPEERVRLFGQLEETVRRLRPWLPLVRVTDFVAVRREVDGAHFSFEGYGVLSTLAKARVRR